MPRLRVTIIMGDVDVVRAGVVAVLVGGIISGRGRIIAFRDNSEVCFPECCCIERTNDPPPRVK